MIFLSMHMPCIEIPEAGQKICHRHLVDFIKNGYKVDLVCSVNESEKLYIKENNFSDCESVSYFQVTKIKRIFNLILKLNLPFHIAIRADRQIEKKVTDILAITDDKNIFIEYAQGAFLLPEIISKYPNVKATVVFHDVISQSIMRKFYSCRKISFIRFFYYVQMVMIRRWEAKVMKLASEIIVLNDKDKVLLEEAGCDSNKITIEYPLVSKEFYNVRRIYTDENVILFWGAMNRWENQDAVLWFISEIFPRIHNVNSQVKLIVLGANPPESILSLASNNIIITGFVENPIPYFEKASLVVAPLRLGAGIKLKVLEALAAKVPVVATTVAAEGVQVDDEYLMVSDDPITFSAMVINCLAKNKEKR